MNDMELFEDVDLQIADSVQTLFAFSQITVSLSSCGFVERSFIEHVFSVDYLQFNCM